MCGVAGPCQRGDSSPWSICAVPLPVVVDETAGTVTIGGLDAGRKQRGHDSPDRRVRASLAASQNEAHRVYDADLAA